jgi:multiple sugar transport system substrate-binding protein
MRKTLKSLAFGAAAMALVLSACSGAAPAPTAAPAAPAKPAATAEPITIEYWQYNFASRIEAMNDLIKQFEAENPGIKVVHNSEIPTTTSSTRSPPPRRPGSARMS